METLQRDAGLLLLRIGTASAFAYLIALRQTADRDALLIYPKYVLILALLYCCTFLVLCGTLVRPAAAAAAVVWIVVAVVGLNTGEKSYGLPIRDCEFAFVFTALAFTGPGRFSVQYWRKLGVSASEN